MSNFNPAAESVEIEENLLDQYWQEEAELSYDLIIFLVGNIEDFHQDGSLALIYEEIGRMEEYKNSFFSLDIYIWDREQFSPALTSRFFREVKNNPYPLSYAEDISDDKNSYLTMDIHYRTDEGYHALSYEEFYRELKELEPGRNLINLNSRATAFQINLADMEQIEVKRYSAEGLKTALYQEGNNDLGRYGYWYKDGVEFLERKLFWDSLGLHKVPFTYAVLFTEEYLPVMSVSSEVSWKWIFTEEEKQVTLEVWGPISSGYYGLSSTSDSPFLLQEEQLQGLWGLIEP